MQLNFNPTGMLVGDTYYVQTPSARRRDAIPLPRDRGEHRRPVFMAILIQVGPA